MNTKFTKICQKCNKDIDVFGGNCVVGEYPRFQPEKADFYHSDCAPKTRHDLFMENLFAQQLKLIKTLDERDKTIEEYERHRTK